MQGQSVEAVPCPTFYWFLRRLITKQHGRLLGMHESATENPCRKYTSRLALKAQTSYKYRFYARQTTITFEV